MANKLENHNTAPKTYSTILNRLLYYKNIPVIPPLSTDDKFASDFYEKANLFNIFFESVCSPIKMQVYFHLFCIEQIPE